MGLDIAAGLSKGKKGAAGVKPEEDAKMPLLYDEFDALRLTQNEGKSIIEFDTLDAALDEFYAKVCENPFQRCLTL